MRPMLGRLKNLKNRKIFGSPQSVLQVPGNQGFERFFRPGPIFRKIGEKKLTPRIPPIPRIRRKWSHRPQDKPWEPCACFPDYGRGQALTPSNNLSVLCSSISVRIMGDRMEERDRPPPRPRENDGRQLFVGSLSFETNSDSLRWFFSKIGEVTFANVFTDRETGNSKGSGKVKELLLGRWGCP